MQVRLITSRETRRWVIPKGWPMKGLAPHKAAAREAFEEAGLLGSTSRNALGMYTYEKRVSPQRSVTCDVMVFPMRVKRYLKNWPERSQRIGFWFTIESAAAAVQEEELRDLILAFGALMAARFAEKQAAKAAGAKAGAATVAAVQPATDPAGALPSEKGKGKAAKAKAQKSGGGAKARGKVVAPSEASSAGTLPDTERPQEDMAPDTSEPKARATKAGSAKTRPAKTRPEKAKTQKVKDKVKDADPAAVTAPPKATGGDAAGKKKGKRTPEGVTLH